MNNPEQNYQNHEEGTSVRFRNPGFGVNIKIKPKMILKYNARIQNTHPGA